MDLKKNTPIIQNNESNDNNTSRMDRLPESLKEFFSEVAGTSLFVVRFFKEVFRPPYEFKEVVNSAMKLGTNLCR